MDTPLNELVATIVDLLDVDLREEYEERAAIMQFSAYPYLTKGEKGLEPLIY